MFRRRQWQPTPVLFPGKSHGRSWTRLNEFTFTFHFLALEKEMATHSSILAWRIPGTGEPGGLPSNGLHRVGHDWNDLAAAAAAVYICQSQSPNSSHPFSPLSVHKFVLCVSVSSLQNVYLQRFPRFHIHALIYGICFSLSDLHFVW